MSQARSMSRWLPLWLTLGLLVSLLMAVAWLNVRGEDPLEMQSEPGSPPPALIERGAYLARAGNCAACHTTRGGAAYAGGKGITTPFGTVYSSNLTPSTLTGLGGWSAGQFWRAMHHGRSRDGRLLNPAFPYTSFTHITRADSDALFAYLRQQPAVEQFNRPHELRFPYNSQLALGVWRALYFKPGGMVDRTDKSADWNRGAYLVQGLGHCAACHAGRNSLGASQSGGELGGGVIPMLGWFAPALSLGADMPDQAWVDLLKNGVNARASVLGPMAEVVASSTQHLTGEDLRAVVVYLKDLPKPALPAAVQPVRVPEPAVMQAGAAVYARHCAQCHGKSGQGAPGSYAALAGNPHVTWPSSINLQQVLRSGGFAPSTAANPRPYGMPPFAQVLDAAEMAAVLSYIRNAWGNQASAVTELEILQSR